MKNNMVKKLLAGSMALVVGGAGLTGAYGYEKNVMDEVKAADEEKAEDKKAQDKNAEDKDVEKLEETAEKALDGAESPVEDKKGSGEIFKEESVYIKADPAGEVTETTVTEWLKNPGNGDVDDESGLSDIKNVKGEETFSKGSGNELKWKSEGEDIYYQGAASGSLPVGVKVSYKLDGKNISAKELNGKSGKVEINIQYTNNSRKTVKLKDKKVKMYTPFTMVTATMLSTDEYTNVEVDNGKVISDGDKNIVVGLGFPGLQENLNLDETDLDIEIPDNVKITADVTKASVNPTVTMASAEIMNEFNMDDIDSFDELEESLDELEDAAQKLKDGSKEAADGAQKLADGSKDLKDGTKNLKSGTKELKSGTKGLKDGTKELKDGSSDLADGSKQVADGVSTLNEKSGDLIKGVNSLVDGVNTYTSNVKSIAEGSRGVEGAIGSAKKGAEDLEKGAGALIAAIDGALNGVSGVSSQTDKAGQQIDAAENALDKVKADVEYTGDTKAKVVTTKSASQIASESVGSVSVHVDLSGIPEEYRGEVKAAVEKAENEANAKLKDQAEKVAEKALDSTRAEITEERKAKAVINTSQAEKAIDSAQAKNDAARDGAADMKATLTGLKDELTKLQAGAEKLEAGIGQIQGAADTVATGAEKLNAGSSKLLAGTSELKKGGEQLAGGVKQLDKGASAVADGAGKLKAGAGALDSGAKKLDDGAGKLDDGAGKLDNGTGTLVDGSKALADGNKELSDGMSEFKEEGIDKLMDTFDGDFQNVKDRLNAMSDMSKEYKSYAGIKKGMDGKTKFIIETEGIDDEEK